MWPAFHPDGRMVTVDDCVKMSDQELYLFLEENLPAVAETVGAVNDANRESILALLKHFSEEEDKGMRERYEPSHS